MAEACDFRLQADLATSCGGMSTSGMKNKGKLVNYDDVDWDTLEYAKDEKGKVIKNRVVAFSLKQGGKRAYDVYVPGNTPFTGTNKALATGTYRNKFTKHLAIVVLNNGADVSANVIDKLANGRFVAIMENDFQGENKDNTFEFYGLETGLAATEMSDDKYSEDTDGGWSVALEETNAPTSGIFYLKDEGETPEANLTATRNAIESLTTPTNPAA